MRRIGLEESKGALGARLHQSRSSIGSVSHGVYSLKYNESVRTLRKLHRRWREARMFASAMVSTDHRILAQVVPIRRCNLSCAYCNEFDKTSEPGLRRNRVLEGHSREV